MVRAFSDRLRAEERLAWDGCLARNLIHVRKGDPVIRTGDRPDSVIVVMSGWAQRYKQRRDGRRQIVSLYLPGEVCDQDALGGQRATTTLAGVRELAVALVAREEALDLFERFPGLQHMRRASVAAHMRIGQEWSANLGLRNAEERIAHLCCELLERQGLQLKGAISGELPLTQAHVGECLGLTPVHVNRTVKRLRARCGLDFRNQQLRVADAAALASLAEYDGAYLILRGEALDGHDESVAPGRNAHLEGGTRAARRSAFSAELRGARAHPGQKYSHG